MATEQERWNQAQRNTGNAMRGTQSGGPHQAERTTGNVMHGTYPGTQPKAGFGDQAGHDKAYKDTMKAHVASNPARKPSPSDDVRVAQGLLKNGADPKKLQNSIAAHSPHAAKCSKGDPDKYGRAAVGAAAARNAKDEPRAARENIKPGHEVHRGAGKPDPDKPDPKPPSPSGGGGSKAKEPSASQAQMAAWYQSQNRGR